MSGNGKLFHGWRLYYKDLSNVTRELRWQKQQGGYFPLRTLNSSWITRIDIFADEEDIEGLKFFYHEGGSQDFRANYDRSSPGVDLAGKGIPIGFKVWFVDTAEGAED